MISSSNFYDFLIVGDGLSASLLAYSLHEYGSTLLMGERLSSTSLISSSLFQPFGSSQPFLEEALAFYQGIEKKEQISFISRMSRFYPFSSKHGLEKNSSVSVEKNEPSFFLSPTLTPVPGFFRNESTGWIDVKALLKRVHTFFEEKKALIPEFFQFNQLTPLLKGKNGFSYRLSRPYHNHHSLSIKKIIFCTGENKNVFQFFSLPSRFIKGEIALLHIPPHELLEPFQAIYGAQDLQVRPAFFNNPPTSPFYVLAGSTYERNFSNPRPSPQGLYKLQEKWTQHFPHFSFSENLIALQAGVRAYAPDHLPIVGEHPSVENCFFLGALGSQGVTFAPSAALIMKEAVISGKAFKQSWDTQRFF